MMTTTKKKKQPPNHAHKQCAIGFDIIDGSNIERVLGALIFDLTKNARRKDPQIYDGCELFRILIPSTTKCI